MEQFNNSPELSIIIVNWNTKVLLAKCLQSIIKHLHGLNYDVFVVDNGSTDGSVDLVHNEFPDVVLITNYENVGFARANNQAIKQSQGKYILLLNSDAELLPNAIQKMISTLESDNSIGIAGAQLIFPDGKYQPSHFPLPNIWTETIGLVGLDKLRKDTQRDLEIIETGTVSGACMLIRKTLIDQIGLLDESFFMFNEEVDLCNRCHTAGSKVVCIHSAVVIHTVGGSTGPTVQRIVRLYSSKLLYFNKHFGPTVENNLKRVMVITALLKELIYRFIRYLSLGKIRKDEYWIAVSRELLAISK